MGLEKEGNTRHPRCTLLYTLQVGALDTDPFNGKL